MRTISVTTFDYPRFKLYLAFSTFVPAYVQKKWNIINTLTVTILFSTHVGK